MAYIVRTLTIFAALSVVLSPQAQQVQSIAQTQGSRGGSATAQAQSPATRLVSVSLGNVTLREAIAEISREAGITIGFSAVDVGQVRSMVSANVKNVMVVDALRSVLTGTGLQVRVSSEGDVDVVRGKVGRAVMAQGIIAGKIIDSKTGKGVSGATVSLGTDTRGAVTDEDGAYRINGVSAGTHTVTVRLVGYAKQTRSVTVGEGATVTIDFKLEPSASVLDQVIVTGTVVQSELRSVPNAITVITAKQIEERGITRIDQLFRGDVPGLFSLNLGSNALLDEITMFSRGATTIGNTAGVSASAGTDRGTNPIKTYIDGVELADSKYLSQIDPTSIERIEILTGSQASTIYGSNAINGVMQIFTKRGNSSRPQLRLSISGGVAQNNFSSNLAPSYIAETQLSGIEGRISYNVGGSWNYIGSWTPSRQTQRVSANSGGRMEWSKLTADVSGRRGLTQNRQQGHQSQGQTELGATGVWSRGSSISSTRGLPQPQTQTLLGQTLGFSLSFRPLSWWSHDVGFGSDASTTETIETFPGLTSLSDTTLTLGPSTTARTSQRYTTTMQLSLSSLARLNLTIGGDHLRIRGSSWQGNPSYLNGIFLCATNACVRTQPNKNSGAFVQGQFGLFDALFFTYGVRADWNPAFGDKAKVKPGRYGISIARDVGPVSAKLRGSYGRSIRPPAEALKLGVVNPSTLLTPLFGAFDSRLDNPDLGPEHQQGGEGGIELYLGARASLVVTRYNQTVDNIIFNVARQDSVRSLLPNNSFCSSDFRDTDGHCYVYQTQYLNVGSIRNQGWELTSSVNLGPLTTHGTYSWVKSRVLGVTPKYKEFLAGSQFEPGRPFDYVPEHTWALGITYARSTSSLYLSVNGIGMRYIRDNALSLAASGNNRLDSSRLRMSLNSSVYRPIGAGYTTADLNATHRFSSRIDSNS